MSNEHQAKRNEQTTENNLDEEARAKVKHLICKQRERERECAQPLGADLQQNITSTQWWAYGSRVYSRSKLVS